MEPSDFKFKELILYIAKRSFDDPFYGATKLNKILFFSDFLAFKKFGKSVSGQTYRKLDFGPAPTRMQEVRDELIRDGDAARQKTELEGFFQDRLIHLRDPHLEAFSSEEIALVEEMIALLRNKSATEVSEFSHRFIGWQVARIGEEIPYETVWISSRELTDAEQQHAKTLKSPFPEHNR